MKNRSRRPAVSVLLIREGPEQLTGSGCCGKLEGESADLGGRQLFRRARQEQRDLGLLHRAIRQFFPPVDGCEPVVVETVDPRNQLYLIPKIWSDVLSYRPGFWRGLASGLHLFSLPAVIVNGRVISRRRQPLDPDTLCHVVREQLDAAGQREPGRSPVREE